VTTPSRGAVLRVGLALLLASACSPPAPRQSTPAGPLRAIAPAGPTDWPVTFTWAGAAPDAVVRVRVFDEAERVVYGMEARGTSVRAPSDLEPLLERGAPYQWRVARLDENGEETDQSEMTAFTVRQRRH
jgi:hypothetical protein